MSFIVRIARLTLLLKDFLPVAKKAVSNILLKQIKKAFNRHPEVFQKYYNMALDITGKTAAT